LSLFNFFKVEQAVFFVIRSSLAIEKISSKRDLLMSDGQPEDGGITVLAC